MTKQILAEYIDACVLVKETENEIKRLRQKKKLIVTGNVKGSNPDFPFQEQHFKMTGSAYSYEDDAALRQKEKVLTERKQNAESIKTEVEKWLNTVPLRMQRIIKYRVFEGMTWEETAARMGKKATGESIRKELDRFLEEK